MGLPMFREPSPVEAKPKVVKTDPTANGRSSIRRQPSTRPSRFEFRQWAQNRLVRAAAADGQRNEPDQQRALDDHFQQLIELEARNRERMEQVRNYPNPAFPTIYHESRRSRASRNVVDGPILTRSPPPPPHDNTYHLTLPSIRTLEEASRRGANPHSPNETQSWSNRFAPAHPFEGVDALRAPSPDDLLDTFTPQPRSNRLDRRSRDHSDSPRLSPGVVESLPPLRRVGHRQVSNANANARPNPEDGLGDRQRSPSVGSELDMWNSILTTIVPDDTVPSTNTSFSSVVSRALSRNTSRSRTRRSSVDTPATQLSDGPVFAPMDMTPSFGSMPDTDPGCDNSDSGSDTETDSNYHDPTPAPHRRDFTGPHLRGTVPDDSIILGRVSRERLDGSDLGSGRVIRLFELGSRSPSDLRQIISMQARNVANVYRMLMDECHDLSARTTAITRRSTAQLQELAILSRRADMLMNNEESNGGELPSQSLTETASTNPLMVERSLNLDGASDTPDTSALRRLLPGVDQDTSTSPPLWMPTGSPTISSRFQSLSGNLTNVVESLQDLERSGSTAFDDSLVQLQVLGERMRDLVERFEEELAPDLRPGTTSGGITTRRIETDPTPIDRMLMAVEARGTTPRGEVPSDYLPGL